MAGDYCLSSKMPESVKIDWMNMGCLRLIKIRCGYVATVKKEQFRGHEEFRMPASREPAGG